VIGRGGSRYEPREIEGRWAIYGTAEDRVTGWFGRGEDERRSAASHALQMNEALRRPEEGMGFHAAIARTEAMSQRQEPHGDRRRT
jgi:hypothetical protein